MTSLQLQAVLLCAVLLGGAVFAFAATRRWAKYEREMQSPSDDPPDALEETEFAFTRLRYRSNRNRARYQSWGIDANTSERLFITGLRRLTRIYGRSVEHIVDVDDDEMFDWPWIYAVSAGDWVLTEDQAARLRRYFDRGGFLVIDDLHGPGQWDQFMYGMNMVYPEAQAQDLENDHPIFHTVYDLTGRLQVPGYQIVTNGLMYERADGVQPYWRVINDGKGRVQVGAFLNQDLGDAWEFSNDPAYPEQFASMSYRVGVNYVVYALTH
ncbi:MAG: DUF4159 domain-containing protein [Acidobacteriota bacterium]